MTTRRAEKQGMSGLHSCLVVGAGARDSIRSPAGPWPVHKAIVDLPRENIGM